MATGNDIPSGSGVPTDKNVKQLLRIVSNSLLGRSTYQHFAQNYPHGIPIVATSYYQERVLSVYAPGGVVDEARILREKWDADNIEEYRQVHARSANLFDTDLWTQVPKGEEMVFLLRKGVTERDIWPWPGPWLMVYTQLQLTRSATGASPYAVNIVDSFRRAVRYSMNVCSAYEYPLIEKRTVVLSTVEEANFIPLIAYAVEKCSLGKPTLKRYPAPMYDDEDLEPDSCPQTFACDRHSVRATDVPSRCRSRIEVEVSFGVPTDPHTTSTGSLTDLCDCIDCLVDRQKKKTHDIRAAFAKLESFTKSQTYGTVIYAPNASGKSTACALLRSLGYAAFEVRTGFDWFALLPYAKSGLFFATDPSYLQCAIRPIAIIPSKDHFNKRVSFRRKLRPSLRYTDPYRFNFPPNVRFLRTDLPLTNILHTG